MTLGKRGSSLYRRRTTALKYRKSNEELRSIDIGEIEREEDLGRGGSDLPAIQ